MPVDQCIYSGEVPVYKHMYTTVYVTINYDIMVFIVPRKLYIVIDICLKLCA